MNASLHSRSRRGLGLVLTFLWVFTLTLIVLGVYLQQQRIEESRSGALRNAERDLANLTRVSQEHAIRTLRNAEQVIRFVASRYSEIGKRLDLSDLTRQGVIDAEIFNQVGIIDAQGIFAMSNLPVQGRVDLSDREHFRVHLGPDKGKLFVSSPVIGRVSQKWSVQLTRRISLPGGGFGGVVVVSIDPSYFTRFYSELNLGRSGVSALYRANGIALARRVGDKEEFGSDASSSALFREALEGKQSGTYVQQSVVDGVERMYYFRTVPGYELVVVAGLSTDDLLAAHEDARRVYQAQAVVLTVLLLSLALAISWHLVQIRNELQRRERTQEHLQERTGQLHAILELSPDGFVSFDSSSKVQYANVAFCRMTGLQADRLIGLDEQDFSAVLAAQTALQAPFPGVAALRAHAQSQPAQPATTFEVEHPQRRVYQVSVRQSSEDAISQILYVHDVTREAEIDQMKSEFLATAAHELRTPMASVYGFSEVLLNQTLDPQEQRELLTIVHQQSAQMAEILNELLDLARIEARRGKDFRYNYVCLQTLLREQMKGLKLPAGRNAPVFKAPQDEVWLMADASKLKQAISNVLSNAYKYSPGGGAIEITLSRLPVVDMGAARVQIQVSDYGMGMTPEQTRRVFERFYRADTSGKIHGTGLGMSIVKEIVELHQGTVAVSSQSGQGTTVTMVFPDISKES